MMGQTSTVGKVSGYRLDDKSSISDRGPSISLRYDIQGGSMVH